MTDFACVIDVDAAVAFWIGVAAMWLAVYRLRILDGKDARDD